MERGDIGANISADVPRNDSNEGWSISANLVGDHDWTKLSLLLYSGDASEIKVSFNYGFFGNTCTGKLYFDDISFEEHTFPSTSEWKMLFVILPNSEISLTDVNGNEYIGRDGVSAQEIKDIQETVQLFKEDALEDSDGKLQINAEIKIIDKPITKKRHIGDENLGPTLYTEDAYEIIKDEVDIDEYDYITVFGNLNLPNTAYYALSFFVVSFLPFYQGTGYTIVNTQIGDFSENTEWRPALLLHEFLHYMEDWCRMLNQELPSGIIDHAQDYGYEQNEGPYKERRKFYIDVMNQNVLLENGEKVGIPDAVWKVTPKEFRFTRVNILYEEE